MARHDRGYGKPRVRPRSGVRDSSRPHREAGGLRSQIQGWAADYTKEEVYRIAQRHRVPVFPENTIAGAVESGQVGPGTRYWAVSTLGQHTDVVTGEIIGLSDAEIAMLRDEQVVA